MEFITNDKREYKKFRLSQLIQPDVPTINAGVSDCFSEEFKSVKANQP